MAFRKQNIFVCDDEKCDVQLETVWPCDCDDCKLMCCGSPMKKLDEQTADFKTEKHVPVVEKIDGGVKVTVGSTLHPMEEEHFIQWIEIQAGSKVYREYLSPGQEPTATFKIDGDDVVAREHCNVHGLWKS